MLRRTPFVVVLFACGVLAACRSAPAGPPPPPAAAIVEGLAGAGVPTDTIDSPFTVSVDKARWGGRKHADDSGLFWDDVASLDVAGAERRATSVDERTFALALRMLMIGDPDAAAVAFQLLHTDATDPLVRGRARVGLTMALTWHSDWAALARMPAAKDSVDLDTDSLSLHATVERWAHAFANVPPPQVEIPDRAVVLPLRRSSFGTPVVTVSVNGHPHEFWLDTGASMTLLSTDVAIEAGVHLAASDTLALGVVAGHIEARAILIDSLSLGPVIARGLPAAVVGVGTLRLDQRVMNGSRVSVPIEGVIGTDLLRQMDLVLDAGGGTLTIRRPRREVRTVRNLFWVGYPVVRLIARNGQPVLFGLDTGAEGTYVTHSLLRRLPRTPVAARRGTIGGLGAQQHRTEWVARELAVSDGEYALALHNAPVAPDRRWTFVTFDGVIGSDVALGARLHLDFANGVFEVRSVGNESKCGLVVC